MPLFSSEDNNFKSFKSDRENLRRLIRSWKEDICHAVQGTWMVPCLAEEVHGAAILHRHSRLKIKLKESDDDVVRTKLEVELAELRVEYGQHQHRMREFLDAIPYYAPSAREYQLLRDRRDQGNRPYSWVLDQRKCADFGGCCGRSCGCCERALYSYLRPKEDVGNGKEKELIEVFAHCTGECVCCIQSKGCHAPHPLLPPTEF